MCVQPFPVAVVVEENHGQGMKGQKLVAVAEVAVSKNCEGWI